MDSLWAGNWTHNLCLIAARLVSIRAKGRTEVITPGVLMHYTPDDESEHQASLRIES